MSRASPLEHDTDPQPLLAASTAPLVGVLLPLLALWIGAIPKPEHSVNLDIEPCCASYTPSEVKDPIHTLAINPDGSFTWDGKRLPDRAALDARLQAVGAVPYKDQAEVHIKPHRLIAYGAVVAVMAAAQRNSAQKIGLSGEGFSVLPWRGPIDTDPSGVRPIDPGPIYR